MIALCQKRFCSSVFATIKVCHESRIHALFKLNNLIIIEHQQDSRNPEKFFFISITIFVLNENFFRMVIRAGDFTLTLYIGLISARACPEQFARIQSEILF